MDSSSRYLRAIEIPLIAWLIEAGPVAMMPGMAPADSRTTLQMAPASLLGTVLPDTLRVSRAPSDSTAASDARPPRRPGWRDCTALPSPRAYGFDCASVRARLVVW